MATWVMNTIFATGYAGIVMLMFLENVFPPIPSELIMPLAGYMGGSGKLAMAGIILAGTLGSVLGALPLYYAGRKYGEERLKSLADRHGCWLTVSRADLDRAQSWFERHGGVTVLFCRLVPGLRSLISIPAGLNRMHLGWFLLYTTIGAALWTTLLAYAGYLLGQRFEVVEQYLNPVSWVVFGGIVLYYVYRVVQQRSRRPAAAGSS